jgi:hypothetical protein
LIVFFALTGALQVLGADDWPLPAAALDAIDSLFEAHEDQRLRRGTALRPVAEGVAIAMAVALALTSLIGIALAWRMFPHQRKRTAVVLGLGIVLPLLVWSL